MLLGKTKVVNLQIDLLQKLRKCGFLNLLLQFGTEKERGKEKNEKKKETLQKKKKRIYLVKSHSNNFQYSK